jgi:hypothetical protein
MNHDIMRQIFPTEMERVLRGQCPFCEAQPPYAFRDAVAYREFRISGLCQACQDESFADPPDEECGDPGF